MKYEVYIPTLGRLDKQETLAGLGKGGVSAMVVCPANEEDYHLSQGRRVLVAPAGIGHVRHAIMQHAQSTRADAAVMFDDDMRFFKRVSPQTHKLTRLLHADVAPMVERLAYLACQYGHAGLSARQGSNNLFPIVTKFATRANNVHAVSVGEYFSSGSNYARLPLMEDFDVTLNMLTQGIVNAVICDHSWDQLGSNAAGGCSTYRDSALQTQAANALHELYPEFVKVVEKTSKTAWDGMNTRTDVRIQWRKAFASSGRDLPADILEKK